MVSTTKRLAPLRVRFAAVLFAALPLAMISCKRTPGGSPRDRQFAAARPANGPLDLPPGVVVLAGLTAPATTIDRTLALLRPLAALPLTSDGLLDLLAQRAGLPQTLLAAIDAGRPVWLLGLDERMLKQSDPAVMVFPLRSRKSFEHALADKMLAAGSEGGLTRYLPKPGVLGLSTVLLALTADHVIVPSSPRAFELVRSFITEDLTRRVPEADVVAYVQVDRLARRTELAADRAAQTLGQALSHGARSARVATDKNATGRELKRLLATLSSAKRVTLLGTVAPHGLSLTVRVTGQDRGRIARLIARQRPGAPIGEELLPATSWLIFADHGNPEASAEARGAGVGLLLRSMLAHASATERRMIEDPFAALGEELTRDYTVAVQHRPAGAAATVCAVVGVRDEARAKARSDALLTTLGRQLRAEERRSAGGSRRHGTQGAGQAAEPPIQARMTPITVAGAVPGTLVEIDFGPKPALGSAIDELDKLVGRPLRLAFGFVKGYGIFTTGPNAQEALERMVRRHVEQPAQGPALATAPGYLRVRRDDQRQVGLFALSFSSLRAALSEAQLVPADSSARSRSAAMVSVAFGRGREPGSFEATLELPAEQLAELAPLLRAVSSRKASP